MPGSSEESISAAECADAPLAFNQKSELKANLGTLKNRSFVDCLLTASNGIVTLVFGSILLSSQSPRTALEASIPQNSTSGPIARTLLEGENEFLTDGIFFQRRSAFGVTGLWST